MHHNHGRGVALKNTEFVEAEIKAAKYVRVGIDADKTPLFDVEVPFVERVDGLGNAVGGDGGQETEPAGMDAQNGDLQAANVGYGIE